MKTKRVFALLLALVMCLSLMPVSAFAEGESEEGAPLYPVRFTGTPEGAAMTVFDNEGKIAEAQADGSYLLPEGTCTYSAVCDGYEAVERQEFRVTVPEAEYLEVKVAMAAVSEEPAEESGEKPAEDSAEEPVKESAAVELHLDGNVTAGSTTDRAESEEQLPEPAETAEETEDAESTLLATEEDEPSVSVGTAGAAGEAANAAAEKPLTPGSGEKTIHYVPKDAINDSSLLDSYVEKELGLKTPGGPQKAPRNPTHGFTDAQIAVYSSLLECITETAAGTRSSTVYELEFDDYAQVTWTAEELGYEEITGYNQSEVAGNAYDRFLNFDPIHDALLAVCPFELFWYDKTIGVYIRYGYSYDSQSIAITWVRYTFTVADVYANGETAEVDDDYFVNTGVQTSIGAGIRHAVNNANGIVDGCNLPGDAERLRYYKNTICDLVDYNWDAVDNDEAYGPPWQLIWVFDDDPSTKVVCEGYSKAFQYLCDLTREKGRFSSPLVNCISVTGKMDGENHMWNVVTMENGNNYLVDATNCDNVYGPDDGLFLVGYDSILQNGYAVVVEEYSAEYRYVYDNDTLTYYTEVERTLFDTDYGESQQEQYTVSYEANGGTGAPAAQAKIKDAMLILSTDEPTRDGRETNYFVYLDANGGTVSTTTLSTWCSISYSFVGWNTDPDGNGTSYMPGDIYTGNEGLVLYAQWNCIAETGVVPLPTPVRIGYIFAGWAESPSETKGVTGDYTPDGNTILYAIWRDPVEEYVKRCYRLLMGREGDADGVSYWVNQLKSGKQGGAAIVNSFVKSAEFKSFGLSNEETVKVIYRTMMTREADSAGLAYWKGFLDDGASPHYIVNGFSKSDEFKYLCSSYGINAGTITLTEYRDKNINVTRFVSRNYRYALERKGDADGINYWCERIIKKTNTPQQCAQNFVFSKECVNRNLSNEEFVKMLYRLYMGREADAGGMSYWLGQMSKGVNRQAVANSFANSKEFKGIVAGYGL